MRGTVEERFMALVPQRPIDGCWIWRGKVHKHSGYGLFWKNGKCVFAHRASWEIANGRPIPEGLLIRHKCNNRRCVAPHDLITGDTFDNMQDRQAAGQYARGSEHKQAKVTEEQVTAMRQQYYEGSITYEQLATKYSLSISGVESILRGRKWKHVYNPLNIEWGLYMYATKGSKHWHAQLKEPDVLDIRKRKKEGESMVKIAKDFGVTYNTVTKICYGCTWKHLPI